MAAKKKHYIPYDYEKAYSKQLEALHEIFIKEMLSTGKIKTAYATKEIRAGTQLEIEIYPEFSRKKDIPKEGLKRDNRKAQKNLNDKNSRKQLVRRANHNFTQNDYWITFSYDKQHYPKTYEESQRVVTNYINRLNYRRKKENLGNVKFICITEWSEEVRCHHHFIMDGKLDRETIENTWKHGGRNQVRRLKPDDFELTGLATYLTKDPKGKKRWRCSLNLKKPEERKNHYKFRKKKVNEMVKNQNLIESYMKETYPDYIFSDAKIYYNDINARYYIYARMRAGRNVNDKSPNSTEVLQL